MIKIKPKIKSLNIDHAIIITKIDWKNFPFEKFKAFIKRSNWGRYTPCNAPEKVWKGHHRKNIFYQKSMSDEFTESLYIERIDGWYKVDIYIDSSEYNKLQWKFVWEVREMFESFINLTYTYRHKPLDELRELIMAKRELNEL